MPLYEFKCQVCDAVQEKLFPSYMEYVPFTTECDKCDTGMAVRQVSAPALKFEGKGFHSTDYDKDGPKEK